jgi:hypothetical protein
LRMDATPWVFRGSRVATPAHCSGSAIPKILDPALVWLILPVITGGRQSRP